MTILHTDEANKDQPDYHSFLLRIWHTSPEDEQEWRVTLIQISSGKQFGFSGLEQLFEFLEHLKTDL